METINKENLNINCKIKLCGLDEINSRLDTLIEKAEKLTKLLGKINGDMQNPESGHAKQEKHSPRKPYNAPTLERKLLNFLADEGCTIGEAWEALNYCPQFIRVNLPAGEWTNYPNHTCKELVSILDSRVHS